MKQALLKAVLMGMMLVPYSLIAQAPAGAPAGTTGKCKDGTFTTAPKKQGACRGHKGVDTWYASAAPATSPAATSSGAVSATAETPKAANTESSRSSTSAKSSSAKSPAPGGGPGLVWVNTASNVYHCYGTRYYGTTRAGKYMSEADAKAAGAHPDHGKTCSH